MSQEKAEGSLRFEPAVNKKWVHAGQEVPPRHLRILQVFFHADMRLGHEGLRCQAKEHGIDLSKLVPGQFVVFVNTGEDKVKVFASNNIIAYMQLEHGRKLDLRVIREIPRAFNGAGKLDYDAMLGDVVNTHFKQRKGITHAKASAAAEGEKTESA